MTPAAMPNHSLEQTRRKDSWGHILFYACLFFICCGSWE